MRIVTKHEDERVREEILFLQTLVDSLRNEIKGMRAQIDEAREIPPYFEQSGGKAKVHVLNDKTMARLQRGDKLDEDE